MRLIFRNSASVLVAIFAALACPSPLSKAQDGPYQVVNTVKVGGEGGFDYVNCDPVGRKLYVARRSTPPVVNVYDLDSLKSLGTLDNVGAHGAALDVSTGHGFCSSKPITMFDMNTLAPIKKVEVQASPDGMLDDPYNNHVYVLSHSEPNVTVIDAKDGTVLGTIDIGGAPEQAATDGKGHVYIDIEDKAAVAVIDANTMKMTGSYDLGGHRAGNAGLALDAVNHVLFVACRQPNVMVMLDANSGKYLADLPIGRGCDGVTFNPDTLEAFSSQGADGTLTVIQESSPTTFKVEQTVKTMISAKTSTLDTKTGRILLIAAEYDPAPPATAGNERPRRTMKPGSFSIIVVGK